MTLQPQVGLFPIRMLFKLQTYISFRFLPFSGDAKTEKVNQDNSWNIFMIAIF
jgi:hypothetical protein